MQKDSIKREQSQAGLSFAERKNFRPQVKNKLLLLLVLLMTAATGAWATDYTTLAVGDVIKVGDTFTPTADGVFNVFGVDNGKTYTLIRADVDNDYNVTEKTDGAYYVFKYVSIMSSPYIHFEKAFAVTAISDGLEVTKIETVKGGKLSYTLALHESAAATYTVSVKDGVKDADKWTITPNPAEEGQTVTLQYNGRLKVKGVKATSDAAPAANIVDLSKLTENTELKDGDVVKGTLASNVKISIADGATVTLDGVSINGVNDTNYEWAGITCLGDATIILSGTNTVKGFYQDYPGIQAAAGKTLIINGTGSLTASSYGWGAGIGGGSGSGAACGNIEIQGGTITATSVEYGAGIGGGNNSSWGNITISGGTVIATGGYRGAGIGGGRKSSNGSVSCGNILISGGTITATGGEDAAGIGGGRGYNVNYKSSCGTITITSGVTSVTATKSENATNSIGAGKYGTCGTVTIGGVEGAITTSPYTYQPSN